jgi:hypothetical protein
VTAAFERASKLALVASVAGITVFQLAFHPDLTPALQRAGIAALVAGLLVGHLASGAGVGVWVVAAPLAPAVLRALTGREGPVLDLVWMAGLAGALLRAAPRPAWSLPPAWRVLLGGWALVLACGWPIVLARELNFHWHTLADEGAVNSWAMLNAAHTVAWSLYVVQTQLLGLLWFDWVAGRFARDRERIPAGLHALWIGASLASLVALYQGAVDLQFLSTPFWANERRATGTLLDGNGYGMLAGLAGTAGFLWLRTTGRTRLGIVVLAINVVGFWMSGSRTALVAVVAGALGLVAALTLGGRRTEWRPSRTAGIAAAIAAAVVAVVLIAGAIGPLRRVAEIPLSRAGLADLWSRGGYGTIAVRMIRDTPWTGVGPGMYHVIAPDYWRVMRAMTLAFDNAQNWWRHQLAELGVLGSAPVIAWSVLIALGLLLSSPRPGRSDGWLPRALLLGIGAASLLGMPTQSPVVLLWFFALIAWWSAASTGALAEGRLAPRLAPVLALTVAALVVAFAAGSALLARGRLSVPERARRAHREYVVGAFEPELLSGSTTFRKTSGTARFVWPLETRWFLVRVWVQHPDVARAPVRVTITTRCRTLFDEELRSADPVGIGVEVPEGTETLDAVVHTSRTWRPPPRFPGDRWELGAAVIAAPLRTAEEARANLRLVAVGACDS